MEREAIRKSGSVPDMSCVDVEDPGNRDGEPEVPESEVKKTGRKDSCFRFGDVTVYEPTSGVFYVLPKDSANGLPGENSPGRRDDVSRVREIRKRLGLTTSGSLKLDSRPEDGVPLAIRIFQEFQFPAAKKWWGQGQFELWREKTEIDRELDISANISGGSKKQTMDKLLPFSYCFATAT